MEIRKIVDYVNRAFIASDYLREPDIYYYADLVIDDINERLQARFPVMSDWLDFCAKWNAWVAGPNPIPEEEPSVIPEGHELPPQPGPMPPMPPIPEAPLPGTPNPVVTRTRHDNARPNVPGIRPERVQGSHRPHLPIRNNKNYDAFPDEYIRTVLALGIAVKYYTRDEEGEAIAADYQNRYEAALFKMQRDYINQVPWYFQDHTGGFIDFTYVEEGLPWDLRPRGMVIHGYSGKEL